MEAQGRRGGITDAVQLCLFRMMARHFARMTARTRLRWAGALVKLVRPVIGKRIRTMRRNLELCFPAMDSYGRDILLQKSLVANMKGVLDGFHAWYATDFSVDANYLISGREHLLEAVRKGKGVIVLCAHFPGGELHMRMARELGGVPIIPMVRAFRNRGLDDEVNARRTEHLGGVVARDDVQGFTAAVRRGEGTFYAPDVNVRSRNVFVPFFGVPASTLDAMSVILRRAGGSVVPGWATPLPDGRYEVVFEPQWENFPSKDGAEDARRFTEWVERKLENAPWAYDWGTKRFKTRPLGEPDLYH